MPDAERVGPQVRMVTAPTAVRVPTALQAS